MCIGSRCCPRAERFCVLPHSCVAVPLHVLKEGRGEFLDQELLDGRDIFVRNSYSDVTPFGARFEQAGSAPANSETFRQQKVQRRCAPQASVYSQFWNTIDKDIKLLQTGA